MSTNNNLIILSLLLLCFLSLPNLSHSQCHPQDLKALRRFYQGLGSPSQLSWKSDVDCCSWDGVYCDDYTSRVNNLDIRNLDNVTSHIPDAIGDLPYLDQLVISRLPNLSGKIPFALTRLTRLNYLDISLTKISGPIPLFLSQIKSLTTLILQSNQLSGSIPPSLSSLPGLTTLYLDGNRLTGVIPESFGNFPPSSSLTLSGNRLTGTVPRSFGYANFSWLDLSRNRLVGDVSFLFGKNKTYQVVDLSHNKFSFDGSKIKVNKELNILYVNNNLITGNLPASLKNSKLGFLNVSYNLMCGEIPNVKSLQKFDISTYFHNKCLCGSPLPPCK